MKKIISKAMNWLKTSLLLCSCIPLGFAEEAVRVSEAALVTPEESKEVQMSDNLLQHNPFVPFKSGKSFAENIDISSDFDFLSVVIYPDHKEFSLKEKTKDKPFWLSSDNSIQDETYGLVFWNFYPAEKTLVVQDSFSGNLINIRQKEIHLNSDNASSSSYGNGVDWLSLLSEYDDDDDDDDVLPKKLTKDRK